MDAVSYIVLSRQIGLRTELRSLANNVANMGTDGFRAQNIVFSEVVRAQPTEGGSIAMTAARAYYNNVKPGAVEQTGGTLDLAIQGDGFFHVDTGDGVRLTRKGSFTSNELSDLVTSDGYRVLDAGGGPIFIPPDAQSISIASDGTITADGTVIAQIGVMTVPSPENLERVGDTLFEPREVPIQSEAPNVLQGFLESSNVNPISQISRLIEVQRAYEAGQKMLEREDERVRNAVRVLGTTS
jgi:flagellar basal-body rod protein FlgF